MLPFSKSLCNIQCVETESQDYYNGLSKVKSAKKVTKRAHLMPVLHFLFSVYDNIMECDLLCVTADCGQPRWSIARIVLKRRQNNTRIQNGVFFILRGNSIRPQHELQSECSSLSGAVSARVSILEVKGRSLGNRSNGLAERIKPKSKYDLLMVYTHPSKSVFVRMEW